MALDTFVAGAYTSTYNAIGVGLTRAGYNLSVVPKFERINETDLYGETLIDGIYRGCDATIDYVARAYKAGSVSPFWPFGATRTGSTNTGGAAGAGDLGTAFSPTTPISTLMTDFAKPFVLTAVANTPAAIVGTATAKGGPLTVTAPLTCLAPDFDARLLFDSKLREVPTRLQLLPTVSTAQTGEPASGALYHFLRT